MIHTTIGVYPNGDYKVNGVSSENLASHIWYNITFRPGRSLYVDGALIYDGGLSSELIAKWGRGLDACYSGLSGEHQPAGKASTIRIDNDTAPYH